MSSLSQYVQGYKIHSSHSNRVWLIGYTYYTKNVFILRLDWVKISILQALDNLTVSIKKNPDIYFVHACPDTLKYIKCTRLKHAGTKWRKKPAAY